MRSKKWRSLSLLTSHLLPFRMPFTEALRLALQAIWHSKLRSFFTLLGIIVSRRFPGGGRRGHPGDERLRQGEPDRRHDRHQRLPGAAHPDLRRAAGRRAGAGDQQAAADLRRGCRGGAPRGAGGPGRVAAVGLAHSGERRRLPQPDGRHRADLRGDSALPDRPGLSVRRRGAARRARRARAAAGGGVIGYRRGRQALRRAREWQSAEDPDRPATRSRSKA